MRATNQWITYRTRFLVKAQQLTTSIAFTDVLGRQHSGREGDYLVESSHGVLRIAPRQIFEDIYVPVLFGRDKTSEQPKTPLQYETLLPEETSQPRETQEATIRQRETPAVLSIRPTSPAISPTRRDRRSPTARPSSL